jgi:IQ calmodulin-binding motif
VQSSSGINSELTKRSKSDAVLRPHSDFLSHDQLAEQQECMYRIMSTRNHVAATTIQTLARAYLARKYLIGLRQPFITWSAADFDTSQDRSMFDNDSCSEGTDHKNMTPDRALERRAFLSIVGAFGGLSAKRHMAAYTLQNAFSRDRDKARTGERPVNKGTGYVCQHLCYRSLLYLTYSPQLTDMLSIRPYQ